MSRDKAGPQGRPSGTDHAVQARWLFGTAAAYNFGAVVQMIVSRPWLGTRMQLDEVDGTNLTFFVVAAALVATFGYAYLRVAQDHRTFRPLIELGIVGKSLVVVAMVAAWALGSGGGRLLLLAAGDAIFVVLFARFLHRTRRLPA